MKNFKYPLAIEGSREELEALIPKLTELGYKYTIKSKYPFLVTNLDGIANELGFSYNDSYFTHTRTVVSASNPELVLALAAMVDDNLLHKGEYAKITKKSSNAFTVGKLYKIGGKYWEEGRAHFDVENDDDGEANGCVVSFEKATKEEIIAHFNKQPMEKKIIGYNVKPEFSKALVAKALNTYEANLVDNPEMWMKKDCKSASLAKELGVLDLWFEPVYGPEVEVVTLRCEGGNFEVEVSKEGIYYRPENARLDINDLESVLATKQVKYSKSVGVRCYQFTPSHIDSGCKKQVPREDWLKVIETYNSFQKS